MALTRRAAVAGSWYPGTATALAREVDGYLAAAATHRGAPGRLREVCAVAAPHAGLPYSGPVAAHAYEQLRHRRIDVAVLVGPSHFVDFDGVALSSTDGFETPLGVVPIDRTVAAAFRAASPLIHDREAAHAREHSLEMQLPFLMRVCPAVPIVPLLIGRQTAATAAALGDALSRVLVGRRAVLVASTDLSHYHDARTAATLDGLVVGAVEAFAPDALQTLLTQRPDHACGGGALVAVMRAAWTLGARDAEALSYADSGDVSGDKSSVVGYLAAAFGHRT
ncbi:MAG: AmmeMemoRadiSam system protein B [Vicinamibacterales bacterium]